MDIEIMSFIFIWAIIIAVKINKYIKKLLGIPCYILKRVKMNLWLEEKVITWALREIQ